MRRSIAVLFVLLFSGLPMSGAPEVARDQPQVYVIPVRQDIMAPLVYLVRRGVKEAMEAGAGLVILDMNTDGGRVDVTEEVIEIVELFTGATATWVNDRAFSAGAFIAASTQKIYMAPGSVIGAAAPIMMAPGSGPQETSDTMEVKMTSAVRALVRRTAERNGHNTEVFEAMIDKNRELVMDGELISGEGDILTLTDSEARKEYGDPPKPLLSAGTLASVSEVAAAMGYENARIITVEPLGAEKLATWINRLSPLLLMLGAIGIYLEFKTPGFGLPGIVGLAAFGLYFFGSYVAGLAGAEWVLVFAMGLALVIVEIFVFPGMLFGLIGMVIMFASIVVAMVDLYPGGIETSWPRVGDWDRALRDLSIAGAGSLLVIALLSRVLPRTSMYHVLVSGAYSGELSARRLEVDQKQMLGQRGKTVSALRPGGKAQFGERVIDVVSQGEMVERGARVRIVGYSGSTAVVEAES